MKRSKSHNAALAEKMRDREFAQKLVLVVCRRTRNVIVTLRFAIRSKGIKEFADEAKIPIAHVSAFASGKKAWGLKRVKKALAVFNCELSVRERKPYKRKK